MRVSRKPLLFAMIFMAGCGSASAPLPSGQEARVSLQAALTAWKEGKKPAALSEAKPAINAVDSEWSGGKELENFSIGSVLESPENISFTVTLNLKGASAPASVKYMVFGKEPVQIYRDTDYARMSNMEDGPATPKPKR